MKETACIDCEYSEPVHIPEGMLRCRRYAPRPAPGGGEDPQGIRWPLVEPLDWCGEFLEKMAHEDEDPLESFRPGDTKSD